MENKEHRTTYKINEAIYGHNIKDDQSRTPIHNHFLINSIARLSINYRLNYVQYIRKINYLSKNLNMPYFLLEQ